MVMENVQEVWTEMPKKGKHGKPMTKTRYIPKMFLRGDSVIYVLKNPNWIIDGISFIKTINLYTFSKIDIDIEVFRIVSLFIISSFYIFVF